MLLKARGLVIRVKNISDNDKYLTVLTEEYGKITFRASGVRSFKNKYLTVTQLFSYSEFTLLKMPTFIKMNEAELVENFYNIRLNFNSLALATYITDVASIISVEGKDEDGILNLLLSTLYVISKEKMPLNIIKGVFEMRILSKSGFMPNLESCEICQEKNLTDIFFFDVAGGTLLCGECLNKTINSSQHLVKIPHDIINAIKYIAYAEDERIFAFNLHEDIAVEFSNICEKYLISQIEHLPMSLKFYKDHAK